MKIFYCIPLSASVVPWFRLNIVQQEKEMTENILTVVSKHLFYDPYILCEYIKLYLINDIIRHAI